MKVTDFTVGFLIILDAPSVEQMYVYQEVE